MALALTLSTAAFAGNPTQAATYGGANLPVNQNGINVAKMVAMQKMATLKEDQEEDPDQEGVRGGHGYNNGYGYGGYDNR